MILWIIGAFFLVSFLIFLCRQYYNKAEQQMSSTERQLLQAGVFDKPVVILFFSPRCPHCIKLAPTWEQVKQHLRDKVSFMEINCDDPNNQKICLAEYNAGAAGVPHLTMIKDRVKHTYSGDRTFASIVSFVLQN